MPDQGVIAMIKIVAAFIWVSLLCNCDLSPQPWSGFDSDVQVYFTQPGAEQVQKNRTIIDPLLTLIHNAVFSIDLAIYEFSNQEVIDALLEAGSRGVKIRVAGDISLADQRGYKSLQSAGIQIRLGNPQHTMHHKYMIVDQEWLATGSVNFTDTAFFHNDENLLVFHHPALAAYYQADFETMYVEGLFGTEKTGHFFPGFEENGFVVTNQGVISPMQVFLTPYYGSGDDKRVDKQIITLLQNCRENLYFSVFAFTHQEMAQAMLHSASGGTELRGIFDRTWHENSPWSVHQVFIRECAVFPTVQVHWDGNEENLPRNPLSGGKCHNKFILGDIDSTNHFLLTGSYNFSKSSSYAGNDENFILIRDPGIIRQYYQNFYKQWLKSQAIIPATPDGTRFHDIVISEVMWAGSLDDTGIHREWDGFVELWNPTQSDIDISGWQLEGSTSPQVDSSGLVMTIIPDHTTVRAGECLLICKSTNFAWSVNRAVLDPALRLWHPQLSDFVRLVLKNRSFQVIDDMGSSFVPPLAGKSDPPRLCASMTRDFSFSWDGRSGLVWQDSQSAGSGVRSNFMGQTLASPGWIP